MIEQYGNMARALMRGPGRHQQNFVSHQEGPRGAMPQSPWRQQAPLATMPAVSQPAPVGEAPAVDPAMSAPAPTTAVAPAPAPATAPVAAPGMTRMNPLSFLQQLQNFRPRNQWQPNGGGMGSQMAGGQGQNPGGNGRAPGGWA